MSLPRLTFLCPAFRAATPPTLYRCLRYRHGTAVEPTLLHPDPPPFPTPPRADTDAEAKSQIGKNLDTNGCDVNNAPLDLVGIDTSGAAVEGEKDKVDGKTKAAAAAGTSSPPQFASKPAAASASSNPAERNHVFGPREYVHQFDTYSLVQRLSAGGFAPGQSVVLMKGIRALLDKNTAEARENLVSKSNVENETYLFQAACSELRNEIQNAKKVAIDQLRSERTRIQTEFDLLNQAFMAEIMILKDELNGMFNDRRMVTRAEQRAMENKIQELNYKITILINSDLKSEIEKMRWTTTRRGVIAIALLALFVVTSIRVNNNSSHKKKKGPVAAGAAAEGDHSHKHGSRTEATEIDLLSLG